MSQKKNKGKSAIELFDVHALTYQEKYMGVGLYGDTLDRFCDLIAEKNAAILDIACGPGNITRYLLDKRPDFQILGIDLSPKMLELAAVNNPGARFESVDIKEVNQIKERYEGIVCGFGLPYLSKKEALQFIQDVHAMLKSGGILYLSTMEDDHDKSGFQSPSGGGDEQMYINFHEEGYLREALDGNGFAEVFVHKVKTTSEEGIQTTDMILIAKK